MVTLKERKVGPHLSISNFSRSNVQIHQRMQIPIPNPVFINADVAVCAGMVFTVIDASFRVSAWPIGDRDLERSGPMLRGIEDQRH
jgi:hypothetical protein